MMKEDAQLTCPISFEDPDGHWDKIRGYIEERLPLKEVSWKSATSASFLTINQLPLRFLPSSASLFKDTDHSFRWFLSSYVNLYILVAESLDAYKTVKPVVKKWVEQQNAPKGTLGKFPWLIVYVTIGNHTIEAYQKVFQKISSDFYVEKTGDRSVFMYLPSANNTTMTYSSSAVQFFQQINSCCTEFMNKLKEGIVVSFQHRANLYEQDIKRLEQTRTTAAFDFKQLFLVRESLALLYQMMQLSDMALAQYEELETLLSTILPQSLPDNDWPMIAPEPFKIESKDSKDKDKEKEVGGSGKGDSSKEKDCMSDAIRNGDEIVTYSINLARMKILKNKFSYWELKRYVFSRQIFFLVILKRPVICAQRAVKFLRLSTENLEGKYRLPIDNYSQDHETIILPTKESLISMLRIKQLDCWALSASIKLIRVCRDLIDKIYQNENPTAKIGNSNNSTMSGSNISMSWDQPTSSHTVQSLVALDKGRLNQSPTRLHSVNSNTGPSLSRSFTFSEQYGDFLNDNNTRNSVGDKSVLYKEAFPMLCELLEFSLQKFNRLCFTIKYGRLYHDQLITSTIKQYLPPDFVPSSNKPEGSTDSSGELMFPQDIHNGKKIQLKPTLPIENARTYFTQFYDQGKSTSSTELLQRELQDSTFLQENNLEQALHFGLVSRIRSVSHFWAKIYYVDLVGGYFPSELFSIEDFILDQSSHLPRNQVEKGRVLEVTIALFIYKCFYEMYNLSHRHRFATSSKLKIIEILTCAEQHNILLLMIRNLIKQSIVVSSKPPFNNGNNNSSSLANSISGGSTSPKVEIPSELKLWLYQTYLHSSKRLENPAETRNALSWFTLYEYYNLYRRAQTGVRHSAQLPFSFSNSMPYIHATIQNVSWFEQLVRYSSRNSVSLESKPIFIEARNMISLKSFSFGRLPSLNPPDTNEDLIEVEEDLSRQRCFVKGYELINEERFPATALQYVCNHQRFLLSLHLFSHFNFPVEVDTIHLIFKKIHAESFKNNFGILYSIPSVDDGSIQLNEYYDSAKNSPTALSALNPTNSPKSLSSVKERSNTLQDSLEKDVLFTLGKDELLFGPVGVSARNENEERIDSANVLGRSNSTRDIDDASSVVGGTEKIIIYPGDQEIIFEFFPYSLGEYALDRFYLTINSSVVLYNYPMLNHLAVAPQQVNMPISYKEIPVTHEAIQSYFDDYPLIRITEPENAIFPVIHSSILSPVSQKDYCMITFEIDPNDIVEEFVLTFPSVESVEWIHREKRVVLETDNYLLSPNYSRHGSVSGRAESPNSNNNSRSYTTPHRNRSRTVNDSDNTTTIQQQSSSSTFFTSNSKKSRPTTGSFGVRSRGNTAEDLTNTKEKFQLQILPYSEWKFSRVEQAKDAEEKALPVTFAAINSFVGDSVATVTNIKGNGKVRIFIPFVPIVRVKHSKQLLYRCTINFHLQLQLKRKLCKIPLQIFSQKTIYCGQLIEGTISSHLLSLVPVSSSISPPKVIPLKPTVAIQIELFNLFDHAIEITGYQLIPSVADGGGNTNGSVLVSAEQDALFTLLQGCEEIPQIQDSQSRTLSDTTSPSSGIMIEHGDTHLLSLIGFCKDKEFSLKIRFYFIRNDSIADQTLFKDLVFAYDTSIKINVRDESNQNHLNINTAHVEIDQREALSSLDNSEKTPCVFSPPAQLGNVFIVEGVFSFSFSSNYGKFSIHSGRNLSQENHAELGITSISKSLFLSSIERWWRISVADSEHWLAAGITMGVNSSSLEKIELSLKLKLIPLLVGIVPFPGVEIQVLPRLELPGTIEKRWIVYDEHVSEVEVLNPSLSLVSTRLRKCCPLLLIEEI